MGWQFRKEYVSADTALDEFAFQILTTDESEICVGWGFLLGSDGTEVKHAIRAGGTVETDGRPTGATFAVVETDSTITDTVWQGWACFAKLVID